MNVKPIPAQFGQLKIGALFTCAGLTWIKSGRVWARPVKPCSIACFELNPGVACIFRLADEVEIDVLG